MRRKFITTAAIAFAALSFSGTAQAVELVANGGFETGDFTGWTQFGNTGFTSVCAGSGCANTGTYGATFGPVGSIGGIEQLLNTAVAGNYTISFFLRNDGGPTNSFTAFFDSTPLLLTINQANPFQYFEFTFNRTASTSPSLLRFEFQQNPSFWDIDDISVQGPEGTGAVPEPATWAMMLLGFGGVGATLRFRRRKTAALPAAV